MAGNCEIKQAAGKITITIDLSKSLGPSKSGKTILVASTYGNQTVSTPKGHVSLGVNCYRAK